MDLHIRDLKIGETAEIVGYESKEPAYRSRLLAMGLTKGAVLKLLKLAPFGDPVELEIRGFHLSLRKAEAEILLIRRMGHNERTESIRPPETGSRPEPIQPAVKENRS